MLAGRAPWSYAGKVLWPVDFCFVYPRWELAVHSVVAWLPLAGLALVAATLWQFRDARWTQAAILGLGYFVIALLPVLGFFDTFFFRYSFVADHFQYLACLGLTSLAVSTGTSICERAGQRGRIGGTLAAATVLLVLGVSTWRQARIYQNLETLWRDTLTKNPACSLAHNNLGVVLAGAGKVTEAVEQYEEALQYYPDYAEAHSNLGLVLFQKGDVPDALAHFEQALRGEPNRAETHNNLGLALVSLGRVPEAIGQFKQALRVRPDFAEAYYNLGYALVQTGEVQKGMAQYEQALRIRPDFPEAHCSWADALAQVGKPQEAIAQYEKVLKLNPDFVRAYYGLARFLATLPPAQGGDSGRAIRVAQRACQLTTNQSAVCADTLATAYAAAGRTNEAITAAETAIDLARSAGQTQLVGQIELRLELYRAGQPYR